MSKLNLVMPMAGRGSRFAKDGILEPKPLIDLGGKPFFWWATESILRATPVSEIVFVLLQEHVAQWSLDARILEFYPEAKIVALPEVTAGAAETARLGVAALTGGGSFAINDCDHAFVAGPMEGTLAALEAGAAGALMTFRSDSPNYSFVTLDAGGNVAGTVEKEVASPFAIAGCYLFQSPKLFLDHYAVYARECTYSELYISGIYNQMLHAGLPVGRMLLEEHFAFGTPEEYRAVEARVLERLRSWREPS